MHLHQQDNTLSPNILPTQKHQPHERSKNQQITPHHTKTDTFIGLQYPSKIQCPTTPSVLAQQNLRPKHSNLHHRLWNPPQYLHTHPESYQLLKMCGRKGFNLISPKGIPTFMGSTGWPTTINLTWTNHTAQQLYPTTSTTPPTTNPSSPEYNLQTKP
ncbi:hypothetical protein O181_031895 [Austropuccinia psidii MF-1]|uniref:Uncharacterized protein n=1 Tax=Austropuccinia psidii MF-1 TaxID=1389203 RepID=A0A9Q3CYS3_9BASI|nr:hypothetical protein [Austropuccinia psidii MF-1]